MTAWRDNDELFFQELEKGRIWETYVALKCMQAGLWVQFPPLKVRKNIDEVPEYANQADIWLTRANPLKVEVKSRDFAFTSPKDIPYMPLYVSTVNSWNDATRKPDAIVVVSQITRAIVVIPCSTFDKWEIVRDAPDFKRGIKDDTYAVGEDCIWPFQSLVKAMERRENANSFPLD